MFGFCWHKYTKWKTISEGNILNSRTRGHIGHYITQKRTCENCDKAQIRTQKSGMYSDGMD